MLNQSLPPTNPFDNIPYPYPTATRVVDEFLQKYARATNFFARKCGKHPMAVRRGLIECFRYQNDRWNRVRDAIKLIEKHNRYEEYEKLDTLTFVYYMSVSDYLETGSFK